MTLPDTITTELSQPLDPKRVTIGNAGPLKGIKYLEGEDVIRTANRIFGYGGWGFELLAPPWIVEKGEQGTNHTLFEVWAAHGRLTVDGGGAFADVGTCVRSGAGSGGLEMAIKGAVTDCVKRCLRNYGDQFGLVLYDKTTDMAGLAADFSGASHVELPPVHENAGRQTPSAAPEWWVEFRSLCTAKAVTAASLEAVIGHGPTLKTVGDFLEREDVNFTELVRRAEAKQKELMGVGS